VLALLFDDLLKEFLALDPPFMLARQKNHSDCVIRGSWELEI
jgi:hypothetical protein